MDNSKNSQISHMCWKIKSETTGGPISFSRKLGISKTTFYSRLEDLNAKGANIKFSRKKGTYYFEEDIGDFVVGFGKRTKEGFLIPFDKIVDK
ncbi:MAG: hypothetical protein ACEPOW_02000 [Bacteroidales bacterium]